MDSVVVISPPQWLAASRPRLASTGAYGPQFLDPPQPWSPSWIDSRTPASRVTPVEPTGPVTGHRVLLGLGGATTPGREPASRCLASQSQATSTGGSARATERHGLPDADAVPTRRAPHCVVGRVAVGADALSKLTCWDFSASCARIRVGTWCCVIRRRTSTSVTLWQ